MSIQDQRWINSFLLVRGPRHDVRRPAPRRGRVSQAIHEYPVLGLSALAVIVERSSDICSTATRSPCFYPRL
jgi:hypothetical protein